MKDKDMKRFLAALSKTRVVLPGKTLTDEEKALQIEVFWDELKHRTIEQVEDAFKKTQRELHFFPTPADILGFIQQAFEQRALEFKGVPDWSEPTPEGREKARLLFKEHFKMLNDKWDREDVEELVQRELKFKERRRALKAQAKLLGQFD